jgi:hypothetical protein
VGKEETYRGESVKTTALPHMDRGIDGQIHTIEERLFPNDVFRVKRVEEAQHILEEVAVELLVRRDIVIAHESVDVRIAFPVENYPETVITNITTYQQEKSTVSPPVWMYESGKTSTTSLKRLVKKV